MNLETLKALVTSDANTKTFDWRGQQFKVRGLIAAELDEAAATEIPGSDPLKLRTLTVRCMLNGAGPICSPEDAAEIAKGLPVHLLNVAWEHIATLSGFRESETQEIEGNFKSGQGEHS